LYHTLVVPNIVSDVNGDYRRQDMSVARLPKKWKTVFYIFNLGYVSCMESIDDTYRYYPCGEYDKFFPQYL
jgi:hypothetical protein